MQRIKLLIQKLADTAGDGHDKAIIDIDLMLDYTRVLYADLLEIRKNKILTEQANIVSSTGDTPPAQQITQVTEPVKDEPVFIMSDIAEVPAIDIRTSIGINDKYLYISELFGDDKTEYDNAIKKLNTYTNLQEAIQYTEHELAGKYGWDKEHPTVQSFYSLLNSSFPSM